MTYHLSNGDIVSEDAVRPGLYALTVSGTSIQQYLTENNYMTGDAVDARGYPDEENLFDE